MKIFFTTFPTFVDNSKYEISLYQCLTKVVNLPYCRTFENNI